MKEKYYLKLFDKDLLSFTIDSSFGISIGDIEILDSNRDIFPIQLINSVDSVSLLSFINSRIIPKNRAFVEKILDSVGLSINDKKGIIDISKGLSLVDSYWIVKDNSLKFDDYNLFDNDFSEILSLVAFTGYNSKIKDLISSPEFTTNGMLPKAWRRIDDCVYLYKGSTESWGASNTGFEPFSEFFASQVASILGYNHVDYNLSRWKSMLVSVCSLFTTRDVSYVQIGDVVSSGGIEEVYRFISDLGFSLDFSRMILFDSIVMNVDRHFGNFGLLRDNNTGRFIGFAPIFDNGNSLLSLEMPNDLENRKFIDDMVILSHKNISYYGISYDDLVLKFCGKDFIKDLRKLVNFSFSNHSVYKMDSKRLDNLSYLVRVRAVHFIELLEGKKSV